MRQILSICATALFSLLVSPLGAQDLPWSALIYDTEIFRPGLYHEGRVLDRTTPKLQYTPAVIPDPGDVRGESWYAFTPGRLWYTDDMGVTVYQVSEQGLNNLMFSALAIAHDAPNVLYLGTGISQLDDFHEATRFEGDGVYRSSDQGGSWVHLPFFAGVPDGDDLHIIQSIATSALGDTVLATTPQRILRSVDAGQTWSVVHTLYHPAQSRYPYHMDPRLYHHPLSLRHVFVAINRTASHHDYALMSHDGGESWDYLQLEDDHPPIHTEKYANWIFAADPQDPNVFWVQADGLDGFDRLSNERKIYRSADGGQTWVDVPVVQREGANYWTGHRRAQSIHVHPQGGDTLVLVGAPGVYIGGNLVTEGLQNSVGAHYLLPSDTYLGFRSVKPNNGPSPLTPGGLRPAWTIIWTASQYLDARGYESGELSQHLYYGDVCTSPLPAGTPRGNRYTAIAFYDIKGMRTSTSTFPQKGFHPPTRTPADTPLVPGQMFQRYPYLNETFRHSRLHCHPHRYDILYAGQNSWGGDAWASPYFGRTPSHPDSSGHRTDQRGSQASFSRQQPDRVWAVWGTVYRSDDYTSTWTKLDPLEYFQVHNPKFNTVLAHDANADVIYTDWAVTMDGGQSWELRDIPEEERIRVWDRVVSHPTDPSIIYSCEQYVLRQWTDYLQESTTIAEASEHGRCRDLLLFPNNPDRIWMGTDTGLWESMNAGTTWTRKNRGLPNVPITRVTLSHDWDEILVAAFGRGLYTVPSTSVDELLVSSQSDEEIPASTLLFANYPNPFTSVTTLQFRTPKPATVRLDVYDVLGRRIHVAAEQAYPSGVHQVRWDGSDLPSGVYFIRMQTDGQIVGTQKVVRR